LYKLKSYSKKTLLYIFGAIIPSFAIEILRMVLTNSSGFMQDLSFADHYNLGIHDVFTIGSHLVSSTQIYLGGLFGNSIILLLTLYFVIKCDWRNPRLLFLFIPLSLFIFPLLFGDDVIQTRLLYEIPIQIPAAIALASLGKKYGNLFIFTLCFWLIIISIRIASNLQFIPQ
jgi:hypothetical protein